MAPPRHAPTLAAVVGMLALAAPTPASAAKFAYGVLTSSQKVRGADKPPMDCKTATLKAGRNEFEAFQIVMRSTYGPTQELTVGVDGPLQAAGGASIAASQLVLYREALYAVGTPSNSEGASGLWPDALIPDVDSYFAEKRTAFPMDVPDGQTRAVWVDVLVPMDAVPGDYEGTLSIRIGTQPVGQVAVQLRVGDFTLPSTSSLASGFGMSAPEPCRAHTGQDDCGGDLQRAHALRALYMRAALEHRFTLWDAALQAPAGASVAPFQDLILPLIAGEAPTRLPGARLSAIRLEGSDAELGSWIAFAQAHGFADRLLYLPVHEPSTPEQWEAIKSSANALHSLDSDARLMVTSTMQEADKAFAAGEVDIFAPLINHLEDKADSGLYAGNQSVYYEDWLRAGANRALWAYQSCQSHGCGACGEPTTDPYYTGWPQRVIDSAAVQNRCFPWLAFRLGVAGELYDSATEQLETAWSPQGLCARSGSGDGTLFYPGRPSVIGGSHDIPIESIRMKMIREGMEDYEYLALVASKNPAFARSVATGLFSAAWECAQSCGKLESARDELFASLDGPHAAPLDAGKPEASDAPALDAREGSVEASALQDAPGGRADAWAPKSGGCSCRMQRPAGQTYAAAIAAFAWLLSRARRASARNNRSEA